jgi:hypothetical protein
MSTRDRWIVYPLLYLAIGLGLRTRLDAKYEADVSARQAQQFQEQVITKRIALLHSNGQAVVLTGDQLEMLMNKADAAYNTLQNAILQFNQQARPVQP